MRNLRSEKEIIANWKGDIETPIVSICCLAFNHEFYIEDALEGFLIQETDFPFEILIHDDASIDRTAEIIREYASIYPNIIKPILQTENKFSKGIKVSSTYNYPRAKGEYFALCEGDDYWCAADKLQKQKNFMDENNEFSFCFHKVLQLDQTNKFSAYNTYTPLNKSIVDAKDIILNHFIPTLSIFFRGDLVTDKLRIFKGEFVNGDIFLEVILAIQGKGYRIDDEMGVYRHHDGGVTKSFSSSNEYLKAKENNSNLYSELRNHVPLGLIKYIEIIEVQKCDLNIVKSLLKGKKYGLAVLFIARLTLRDPAWIYFFLKRKFNGGFL